MRLQRLHVSNIWRNRSKWKEICHGQKHWSSSLVLHIHLDRSGRSHVQSRSDYCVLVSKMLIWNQMQCGIPGKVTRGIKETINFSRLWGKMFHICEHHLLRKRKHICLLVVIIWNTLTSEAQWRIQMEKNLSNTEGPKKNTSELCLNQI